MRKLELTTWERLQLVKCFPESVPLVDLKRYLTVLDKLNLTDSEVKEVGLVALPNGITSWQDTERKFIVLLEDAEHALLVSLVEARHAWPLMKSSVDLVDEVMNAEIYEVK